MNNSICLKKTCRDKGRALQINVLSMEDLKIPDEVFTDQFFSLSP
jgi:hypothetical protein